MIRFHKKKDEGKISGAFLSIAYSQVATAIILLIALNARSYRIKRDLCHFVPANGFFEGPL